MYSTEQQKKLNDLTARLLAMIRNNEPIDDPARVVDDLKAVINYHDWRYYVLADPAISDYEYDQLFHFLKKLETDHPELVTPDSPTQRVAYGISEEFPTVEHYAHMLSLENSYDEGDLRDWDSRVKKLTGRQEIEYCVEPKFDGASIALVYENDLLVRGATRGDGVLGEDITNNIRVLRSIPLRAAFSAFNCFRVEVRGEILIDKQRFRKINEERLEEGLPVLANPRNAAAGALRMKESQEVAKRGLEGFVYHISYAVDNDENDILGNVFPTHFQAIEALYKLGFKTPLKELRICRNIDEVIEYCRQWQEQRDTYPYEIDGMVIKVNSYALQQICGSTSHHPRWAIAFKFQAKQAITTLLRVEFQVGRTGMITPVAKVAPTPLAGVTITSIQLFNEDFIREKDLRIGDKVVIERSGDVIPYIVRSLPEERTGKEQPIRFPENCPSCGSKLVKPEGEVAWRCINATCPAQVTTRIIHFVSKDAMDIRGLGEKQVLRFYELGLLKNIADIYRLDYDKILSLEGYQKKSVENLKKAIEASKKQPLHRLIYALGIRYVGQTTAKTLARAVNSIDELADMTEEQLLQLEDIGPKVANSIISFFNNPENRKLIEELKKLGVNTEKTEEEAPADTKLQGKTFLFTGTLKHFTRSEAQKLVEQHGGRNVSAVSSKLDYLVVGESPGSKLDKAKKIGTVKIITEEEFLKMIS